MKIRAVILAGGEGSRLGVLTAKRAKPAVPFAGKYRIIDFTLSNCVNSGIFDVIIIAQYRPQSLIEHIGAGGPWDLNRDFTGGVRIYTPFKARRSSDWFAGTADAIQQNFSFIKSGDPDYILILSGDHIYAMDYDVLVTSHFTHHADLTMATIPVPLSEASRYGIVGVDNEDRVISFIEKPEKPSSNLINMGVYLFNRNVLDRALWEDHLKEDSAHDFGKNILPAIIGSGAKVYAYPYSGYWVDVGTVQSFWKAHMDLLSNPPSIDLNNRSWIIHTRTEERPPVLISSNAEIRDSMVSDGCVIKPEAKVIKSILSPGVVIESGAVVENSILLTDVVIGKGAILKYAILDKRVQVGENARIGGETDHPEPVLTTVGKTSIIPAGSEIQPGAFIGTDVIPSDYSSLVVQTGKHVQTRRLPYEI
jgi:glucose-1-phosphate adenylyltransferase